MTQRWQYENDVQNCHTVVWILSEAGNKCFSCILFYWLLFMALLSEKNDLGPGGVGTVSTEITPADFDLRTFVLCILHFKSF